MTAATGTGVVAGIGKWAESVLSTLGPIGVVAVLLVALLIWVAVVLADRLTSFAERIGKIWRRLGKTGKGFVVSFVAAVAVISMLTVELTIWIGVIVFAGEWTGGQFLRRKHGLGPGFAWEGWAAEFGRRTTTRKLGDVLETTEGEGGRQLVRWANRDGDGWKACLQCPPKVAPAKFMDDLLARRYEGALGARFGGACTVSAVVDNGDGTLTVDLVAKPTDTTAAAVGAGEARWANPGVVEVEWTRP